MSRTRACGIRVDVAAALVPPAAIGRLADQAGEARSILDFYADEQLDRCLRSKGTRGLTLTLPELRGMPEPVQRNLLVRLWQRQQWPLQAMDARHWRDLVAWMGSESPPRQAELSLP